jgi:hypothetical protein
MNQYSKQKAPIHHSVFARIEWNSQNHQKDHLKRNSCLVFDRLEWPRDRLDHQKDHPDRNSNDQHSHFLNSSRN